MELVLLFEVSEENSVLVYSPNENEDFLLIFDRATYTFEAIEDES